MPTLLHDVHWTAGFLDGEGSFSLAGKDARIQATQVDIFALEKLQRLWGGSISPKRPTGLSKKPAFSWALTSGKSVGLMMTLYPLLSPYRKGQIQRVLAVWRARASATGEFHHLSTASDEVALEGMRHLRDGRSLEIVAESIGVSRFVLSMWMQGKNRPYLLAQLETEGKPNKWRYNNGRRTPKYLPEDVMLGAMRRVRAGESIHSVAQSLDVSHAVVSLWLSGKNRPYLLARLQQEESKTKEEVS